MSQIYQGDKNELSPIKYAKRLVTDLTNVEDGAILYEVKGSLILSVILYEDTEALAGGASMISIISGCASIVNNVFFKFLSRLPRHRSDLDPPVMSIQDRMKAALNTLADVTGRDITNLDPLSSISFSCLTPEAIKIQSLTLMQYQANLSDAFTPDPTKSRAIR